MIEKTEEKGLKGIAINNLEKYLYHFAQITSQPKIL